MQDQTRAIIELQKNIKKFVIDSIVKDTSLIKYVEFDDVGNVLTIKVKVVDSD